MNLFFRLARSYVLPLRAAAVAYLLPGCIQARDLVWKETAIRVAPAVGDEFAVFQFEVRNTSSGPILIGPPTANCDCVTPFITEGVLAPGESRRLSATMVLRGRSGLVTKTISVRTDLGEVSLLTLQAAIPDRLSVSPRIVKWAQGGADSVAAKLVRISPLAGGALELRAIRAEPDSLEASLLRKEADGSLVLSIKLRTPGKPGSGMVNVEVSGPGGALHTALIYVSIE